MLGEISVFSVSILVYINYLAALLHNRFLEPNFSIMMLSSPFTLKFVALKSSACVAFPEQGSSWHKYYQPTGYHYFTNHPELLLPGVMYLMHKHRYHPYNRKPYKI